MTASVAMEIFGEDDAVENMLRAMDTALSPPAVAGLLSGVVDPYLRGRASDRFADEGDAAVGGGWAPLSEATVAMREEMGYGAGPINRRTGELEAFITQVDGTTLPHPWGASLTLPGGEPMGELNTKMEHAQMGGVSDAGSPFPARPVLGMDGQDLLFVLMALATHFEAAGRTAGRTRWV